MEFRYKLYCNPTYYGATCGVSCVGKDDKYRHFMCDPATGHKICLPGETHSPLLLCKVNREYLFTCKYVYAR